MCRYGRVDEGSERERVEQSVSVLVGTFWNRFRRPIAPCRELVGSAEQDASRPGGGLAGPAEEMKCGHIGPSNSGAMGRATAVADLRQD